jgi:hypothetical protein
MSAFGSKADIRSCTLHFCRRLLGCITAVRGRSGPRSNFNEHKLTPRWPVRMATLRALFGSEAGWILSKDGLGLRLTRRWVIGSYYTDSAGYDD